MEEHVSRITEWFNHLFAPYALWLLHALHLQPADSHYPLPEYLVMCIITLVIGTLLALLVRANLSVDRPGGIQQVAEMLLTNPLGFGIKDLLEENAGHHADQFIAFTGSISIFVLLANLMGLLPAFTSPTGSYIVTLGCAILTFLYFNWQGIRHHGPLGYAKHFAGPMPALSPLIFPVEIISTSARILSLTVRLWANIFASDLIYMIFLGLLVAPVQWGWSKSPALGIALAIFPVFIPVIFIGLHIFVSIIQAYVFTVLPSIYIGQAVAEEHESI
jgi:F-type H+-transporting ATPase subunit a